MIRMLSAVLVVFAAACGGADAPAKSSTTAQPAAAATPRDTCVSVLTRQRECSDVYLPALVDARIQHDKPAGIAARAEAEGRDTIIGLAPEEYVNDSTDAAIGATCDDAMTKLPPDQIDGLVQQANQCLAADACQAFTDCVIPMTVGMWEMAEAAQAQHHQP
jgi:hypothetical protein